MLNFKFLVNISFKVSFFDPLFLQNNFFIICCFLCLSFLIGCAMLILPYFFSGRSLKFIEKISEYECGPEPFDSATRQPFTVHFYIVGTLFLIFDVEIALLFPWSVIVLLLSWEGFWLVFFFLTVLIIGFIYEWKINAISWNS